MPYTMATGATVIAVPTHVGRPVLVLALRLGLTGTTAVIIAAVAGALTATATGCPKLT